MNIEIETNSRMHILREKKKKQNSKKEIEKFSRTPCIIGNSNIFTTISMIDDDCLKFVST